MQKISRKNFLRTAGAAAAAAAVTPLLGGWAWPRIEDHEQYQGDVVLLLSNDIHSNLTTSKTMNPDGSTKIMGGAARMAAAQALVRRKALGRSLTLDGGDYSQGTPYQDGYQKGWEILALAQMEVDFCTKKRTSGESESMIEEFMLLANQCAAHFARVKQIPFVYRVHEEPNAEKLERLHTLLQACGINDHFAKDVPTPKELSAILEGVRGTPYEQIINTGMLRCMSKALYEEKPKGHYGLVLKDYAHFTSPIRRYPDLAIHRIMTDMLKGTEKETMILRYTDFAERASKQSSEREVIAMQIERKAEDCYKAEYARRHLGECYEGTISGVTQRGLFIELDNGVEGFVPASSLTPSGTSLTEGVRLTDPASGKTWSLGDKMMITIVRADVNLGKIDFEVAPAAKA